MKNKNTTVIFDALYPTVSKSLAKNKNKLIKIIQNFMDNNSEALFNDNPGKRIIGIAKLNKELYDICGIKEIDVINAIAATKLNDPTWKQRNRPDFTLLFLIQYYFNVTNKKKEHKLTIMLLIFKIYAERQKVFFPYSSGTGFENVMKYTINNLSNKFLIKQSGSVYKALEDTTKKANETYNKLLISKDDKDIFIYIINIITRIHNFVKNIAHEFFKNRDKGNYINFERDTDVEKGHILDVENSSSYIGKIVDNTILDIKTNSVNTKALRITAKITDVSQIVITNTVELISKNETKRLENLLRLIMTNFVIDQQQSLENICSPKFMLLNLKTFSKSHTNEKTVIELKDELDQLLIDYSDEYNKTQRVATRSNFKKALFIYFVTHIQSSYCN